MKVIAINGSPRKDGNTAYGIELVSNELINNGIEVEVLHVGKERIRGCIDCGQCIKNKNEKCGFDDDCVNEGIQKIKDADGVLLASPVYYSGITGTMKCFLDRAFHVANVNDELFRHKVGACFVVLRRSGGSTALDQIYKYINHAEMIVANGNYWNIIHGKDIGEAKKDEEGIQILSMLGRNMAWILKLVGNGRGTVEEPSFTSRVRTSFIR
jgi:multimeric flavodoxin WrbA